MIGHQRGVAEFAVALIIIAFLDEEARRDGAEIGAHDALGRAEAQHDVARGLVPQVEARQPIGVAPLERDRGHHDEVVAVQLGRASWRERVSQYVSISVGAVSYKKKKKK